MAKSTGTRKGRKTVPEHPKKWRGGRWVEICGVFDGRFLRHLRASPSSRVRYLSPVGSFSRGDTELLCPSRYRKRTKHKTTTNCGTGKSSFSDDGQQTPSMGIRTTAPPPTIKASSPLPSDLFAPL